MAKYQYTGSGEREFPTLVVTVKTGDTFDAPDGLVAADVVPVGKVTPAAAAPAVDSTPAAATATTQGA